MGCVWVDGEVDVVAFDEAVRWSSGWLPRHYRSTQPFLCCWLAGWLGEVSCATVLYAKLRRDGVCAPSKRPVGTSIMRASRKDPPQRVSRSGVASLGELN